MEELLVALEYYIMDCESEEERQKWYEIRDFEVRSDVDAFMECYIIPYTDEELYWELGEEDLRRDIWYRVYHEYRKYAGMDYNKEADKYLL